MSIFSDFPHTFDYLDFPGSPFSPHRRFSAAPPRKRRPLLDPNESLRRLLTLSSSSPEAHRTAAPLRRIPSFRSHSPAVRQAPTSWGLDRPPSLWRLPPERPPTPGPSAPSPRSRREELHEANGRVPIRVGRIPPRPAWDTIPVQPLTPTAPPPHDPWPPASPASRPTDLPPLLSPWATPASPVESPPITPPEPLTMAPAPAKRRMSVKKGFQNIGSTCYISATLSALTNTLPLVNDLLDPHLAAWCRGADCPTLMALVRIVRQSVHPERGVINPRILKDAVAQHREMFRSVEQQDAHEFFLAVLDQAHEEVLAAVPDHRTRRFTPHDTPSPIQRNFQGEIAHTLTCLGCGATTRCEEVFYVLSLAVPEDGEEEEDPTAAPSTQDLLDRLMRPSVQEFACGRCGHERATARHRFTVLPRVLLLHIQRSAPLFAADHTFVGNVKQSTRCALSFELDAEEHCGMDVLYPPPVAQRPTDMDAGPARETGLVFGYDLKGFVVHLGEEATSGHYKSLVEQAPGQWVEYNDEDVTPVPLPDAAAAGAQDAYLMFYQFSALLAA